MSETNAIRALVRITPVAYTHLDVYKGQLVTSLCLVELNPFLDERGRTAKRMVELVGSLMGRKVFDRPTQSY